MADRKEILGIDIGQVLVEQEPEDKSLSFGGPNYLHSPEMPHAFRVLRRLSIERFEGRLFLVTDCMRKIRRKREEWLLHHDFYGRVGIPVVLPTYCWTSAHKANVCHDLELTHMIDDNPKALSGMDSDKCKLILFRPLERRVKEYAGFVAQSTTRVESWLEVEKLLLP